tara:strand:- start:15505 stop:15810 length:306 start_codon:yes stop_codon:yes gene_type:complete
MRPRKLLASRALVTLEVKVAAGIPLAAAMRQMNINMSRPAVAKLLSWLARADSPEDSLFHLNMRLNLFPEWLDDTSTEPQEQPDTWIFEGHFPTRGQWVAK